MTPHRSGPERHLRDTLAELVREQLGTPIDADRSLFEAGLTSVAALAVHAGLQRSIGAEFPISTLFKYPTTRALAAFLATALDEPAAAPLDAAPGDAGWTPRARRELRAQLRQRKG
ncbi:acyl carrier protein [Cryptosporangium sp. NPDC051539]|uniref:acyl carrier protein n=1 Tax=Cryptosporangium sp. NPDC051539 TaxID=3363962 RepID=UPI00378A4AC2